MAMQVGREQKFQVDTGQDTSAIKGLWGGGNWGNILTDENKDNLKGEGGRNEKDNTNDAAII